MAAYTIDSNGLIDALNNVSFSNAGIVLARIGVRMLLSKSLTKFDYLGRGRMEITSMENRGLMRAIIPAACNSK